MMLKRLYRLAAELQTASNDAFVAGVKWGMGILFAHRASLHRAGLDPDPSPPLPTSLVRVYECSKPRDTSPAYIN